jgi:hypothetical protein
LLPSALFKAPILPLNGSRKATIALPVNQERKRKKPLMSRFGDSS